MKRKSKIHQVFNKITGKMEWSEYPQTQEDAAEQKTTYFHPIGTPPCPTCGMNSVRYTVTGQCRYCANHDAVKAYYTAADAGEPVDIQQATAVGKDYYWNGPENPNCGHNGKVTLKGKCYTCTANTPRSMNIEYPDMKLTYDEAVSMGFKMYRTGEKCKRGHTGWRYTSTRGCMECKAAEILRTNT